MPLKKTTLKGIIHSSTNQEKATLLKWRRMVMLCKNLISEEILSFDPYPDQGLAKIKWIDEKINFLDFQRTES